MDGAEIRQAREKRGLSVPEFAAAAGIDADTLRRIEARTTAPRARTMRRIEQALGVGVERPSDDADLARLLRAWEHADARGRRMLRALAREIDPSFRGGNDEAAAAAF